MKLKLLVHAPIALILAGTMAMPRTTLAAPLPSGAHLFQPAAGPAPIDPATGQPMTPDQMREKAKTLFGEGNAALEANDPYTALQKFEEAYNTYAPELHVFNYNIGLAAYDTGDCVKAKTAFQRFLDLVPDHGERGAAQMKIMEIDRSGCATQQPQPTPAPTPTTPAPVEQAPLLEDEGEDAPILESKKSMREQAAEEEREREAAGKRSGMFIGGVVTLVLGLGSLAGSGVSLILARQKAKKLADWASPKDLGFPEGDYSDDEVFNMDRKGLQTNNIITFVTLGAGVVLTATGVALLVVDRKRNGKGGKRAKKDGPALTSIGPALTRGGGGVTASVSF